MMTDNSILGNTTEHLVDTFQKINSKFQWKVANKKLQINEFDKMIK